MTCQWDEWTTLTEEGYLVTLERLGDLWPVHIRTGASLVRAGKPEAAQDAIGYSAADMADWAIGAADFAITAADDYERTSGHRYVWLEQLRDRLSRRVA